jgi:hypothetical protein
MTTEQAASKQCRFSTMTRADLIDALDRSTVLAARLMESIESMRADCVGSRNRKAGQKMTTDELKAWRAGIKCGLELYAHWQDGTQYVGTAGTTLHSVLREVDDGHFDNDGLRLDTAKSKQCRFSAESIGRTVPAQKGKQA